MNSNENFQFHYRGQQLLVKRGGKSIILSNRSETPPGRLSASVNCFVLVLSFLLQHCGTTGQVAMQPAQAASKIDGVERKARTVAVRSSGAAEAAPTLISPKDKSKEKRVADSEHSSAPVDKKTRSNERHNHSRDASSAAPFCVRK